MPPLIPGSLTSVSIAHQWVRLPSEPVSSDFSMSSCSCFLFHLDLLTDYKYEGKILLYVVFCIHFVSLYTLAPGPRDPGKPELWPPWAPAMGPGPARLGPRFAQVNAFCGHQGQEAADYLTEKGARALGD